MLAYSWPYIFMQQTLAYITEKYKLKEFWRNYKKKGFFGMLREVYENKLKGRYTGIVKRIYKNLAVPLSLNINFMPQQYSIAGSAAIGTAYRVLSEK